MIERYELPGMQAIWTDAYKFGKWLEVEKTVIAAREQIGQMPYGTTQRLVALHVDKNMAEAVNRRERVTGHDLNAFVEIVRCAIINPSIVWTTVLALDDDGFHRFVESTLARASDNPDAGWFHDGMTSYDTEEPANGLLMRAAYGQIVLAAQYFLDVLKKRAERSRGMIMIGRTRGQHAQPITLGVKFANYYANLTHRFDAMNNAAERCEVMKISEAVGMYGTLSPEIEMMVGRLLMLTPIAATQIIPLDRHADLASQMELFGEVLGKLAYDLWLMAQTEVGEVREPFGKKQKGSSAMPHKKNPINLENIMGSVVSLSAKAQAVRACIKTAHERDIAHSIVDRIDFVDCFKILNHILVRFTRILEGMDVFSERMLENIEATRGCIASQRVEMLLKEWGMGAEDAYRAVQAACNSAMLNRTNLHQEIVPVVQTLGDTNLAIRLEALAACFDWKTWITGEARVFALCGLGYNK